MKMREYLILKYRVGQHLKEVGKHPEWLMPAVRSIQAVMDGDEQRSVQLPRALCQDVGSYVGSSLVLMHAEDVIKRLGLQEFVE